MNVTLTYNKVVQSTDEVDIEDIGNCALKCSTISGYAYYIVVRTNLGTCTYSTCGPVDMNSGLLPNQFMMIFKRFEASPQKIEKEVSKFINEERKNIIYIEEIDISDAVSNFVDLKQYLNDYDGELVY